jgi:acetyl esterase/lipase
MQRYFAILVLVCLLGFLSVQAQTPPPDVASWTVDLSQNYSTLANVTYATADNFECKLDAYVRKGSTAPVPTVVHIHGGGWVGGTKESAILGLMPYFEMGFSVVNVEYRLARVALAPAAVEDCRQALRWVMKNAKLHNFDTTRIIVTGGSAGGHLALMTGMLDSAAGFDATREWDQSLVPLKVAAVINWFGITDVKDLLSGTNRQNYAVSWLGSQPNRNDLATRLSPLTYVRKDGPPVFTIHGDNDNLVPYAHAVRLHAALTAAGVTNKLVTIPGGKHGGFSREDMQRIYGMIRVFLKENKIL